MMVFINVDKTKRSKTVYLTDQFLILLDMTSKGWGNCPFIAAGGSESSSFCPQSLICDFYYEELICQFSLLQPAQPPTPTSRPYYSAPWRVAAGSQALLRETADELHGLCRRDVKYGWGGGCGGKVKLTLRDRGLAVAEQGQTSLGYMFMHRERHSCSSI